MPLICRWTLTLAYAGVIFYFSSRPWAGEPLFPYSDKLIHAIIYSLLGYLCVWSLRVTTKRGWFKISILSIVAATAYGIAMEIYQMHLPARSAEIADAIANAIGAFIGTFLYVYFFCILDVRKKLGRNRHDRIHQG